MAHGQKTFFGLAWKEHETKEAKKRQSDAGGDKTKKALPEMFPEALDDANPWTLKNLSGLKTGTVKGDARDKAGSRVGVSGKSIDKAALIQSHGNRLTTDADDATKTG